MPSAKGRARLFAAERPVKELDPESEFPLDDDEQADGVESDSDTSDKADTKDTEHYVPVGRSKLRQNEPLALGQLYKGKRVSRAQLENGDESEGEDEDGEEEGEEDDSEDEDGEEEFDDPEAVDLEGAEDVEDSNDEIDSDDAFGESDDELVQKFAFRGSSKPRVSSGNVYDDDSKGEDEDGDEEDEDEDEDVSEDEDDDDDDEDDDDDDSENDDDDQTTQAEARRVLAQEKQRVLAPLSQAAKADVQKGLAVRQQRRVFDALLNLRIRIQKALSAANSLHVVAATNKSGDGEAGAHNDASVSVEHAVSMAADLLQTLQSVEGVPSLPGSGAKRKREGGGAADVDVEALFEQLAGAEEAAQPKRRRVLDRWAARVQRPTAASVSTSGFAASGLRAARLANGGGPQPLTAVLDDQLMASADRLLKRTQTPRSCAPLQVARRVAEDAEVYDDADFYQLLLKELVDQRTTDDGAGAGSGGPGSAPTVRWAATEAARQAKTRKLVDRKASKGRKMRFAVHEKLQNFMAPEDRRQWEPEAIDRLFSALFGQRLELHEEDIDGEDDNEDDLEAGGGASLEADGLHLFHS